VERGADSKQLLIEWFVDLVLGFKARLTSSDAISQGVHPVARELKFCDPKKGPDFK